MYPQANSYATYQADSLHPELWDGLIGFWLAPCGPQGGALDYSPTRNNGVFAGADPPVWTTGRSGESAVDFPGVTGYAEIPNQQALWNATGQGTWAFWFRPEVLPAGSGDVLLSSATAAAGRSGMTLYLFPSGGATRVYYECQDGSAAVADSSVALGPQVLAGEWYHCAVTWSQSSGGTNRIYFNGVEHTAGATTNSAAWTFGAAEPLRLADASNTFWEIFDGQMHSVCLYDRQLSAGEILKMGALRASPMTARPRTKQRFLLLREAVEAGIPPNYAINAGVPFVGGSWRQPPNGRR